MSFPTADVADPLHVFRFHVTFESTGGAAEICRGAFSEISGLEATMEPVAISEGGRNWGQAQRVGRTTFSTVILRRGMTKTRHLWDWFSHVTGKGAYKHRLTVKITLYGPGPDAEMPEVMSWQLAEAMPVKMKLADLNAAGQEVGVEELHLVHEGISEILPESSSTTSGTGSEAGSEGAPDDGDDAGSGDGAGDSSGDIPEEFDDFEDNEASDGFDDDGSGIA